jgi:hypothetical protein
MPHLPSPLTDALEGLVGREVSFGHRPAPARVQRAVHHGVSIEHGRGLVAAARVRAVEYVATEAMQAVAGLTELETLYLSRSPLGDGRYRAIADTAAVALANIVAETGRA